MDEKFERILKWNSLLLAFRETGRKQPGLNDAFKKSMASVKELLTKRF